MADQSNDVPQSTSNDEVFNNLNEQPAIASVRDDHVDGGSFPEQSSEAVRNLNEPVNEETVTTTSSGVDEDSTKTVTDTSSESSLDYSEQHAEETSLVIFSEPIAESIMTIETHPTANLRLTYESDDHRRYFRDPLVIDISGVKNIRLSSDQRFCIRLLLAACTDNLADDVYLHPYILKFSDYDHKLSDGTIYVPLTSDDINEGTVAFRRLQILKRPLRRYNRRLTPLKLLGIAEIRGNKVRSARQAKKIFNNYNLKAMWIICQLLIEQNRTLQFSNVICWTRKIEEIRRPTLQLIEPIEYDEE